MLLYDSDDSGPENEEMQNSGTGTASAADEIHLYSDGNFDCCDEKGDPILPLAFWKSHNTHFPKLSLIARSVYAIPASQNKSERAFSAAGHIMTDLRTTLDPEHLDDCYL